MSINNIEILFVNLDLFIIFYKKYCYGKYSYMGLHGLERK
jgi:hypothetical protein